MSGPLASYAAGFAAQLAAQGYAECSVWRQRALMAGLSAWMAGEGLGAGQLSPAVVDLFVPVIRTTRSYLVSVRALGPLLGYLRGLGVAPPCTATAPADGSTEVAVRAYQEYLRRERGLCERTVAIYTEVTGPGDAETAAGLRFRVEAGGGY